MCVRLVFSAGYSSTVRWNEISWNSEKRHGLVSAISTTHALRGARAYSIVDINKTYKITYAESSVRARSTVQAQNGHGFCFPQYTYSSSCTFQMFEI